MDRLTGWIRINDDIYFFLIKCNKWEMLSDKEYSIKENIAHDVLNHSPGLIRTKR
jgi:hypothetical protein